MSSHFGALKQTLRRNATGWAVCAIAFAIYTPSLFSEFIRDDHFQIVTNPQIQSWDYLPRLFSTHLWSQAGNEHAVHFYRPLFSLWMLLVNTIGGLSPAWWHFSSIVLHAVTTFAVYKLCDNLLRNRTAALFAASAKNSVEERRLSNFDGRVRIEEQENEDSFIESVTVRAELANGKSVVLKPVWDSMGAINTRTIELKKRQWIEYRFQIPKPVVDRYYLVTKGYYVLPNNAASPD